MAVIGPKGYGELRDAVYSKSTAKADLKALPTLPSKAQLTAAFQAIEDRFTGIRPAIRTDIATAIGQPTITAALSKKLTIAYLRWKIAQMDKE